MPVHELTRLVAADQDYFATVLRRDHLGHAASGSSSAPWVDALRAFMGLLQHHSHTPGYRPSRTRPVGHQPRARSQPRCDDEHRVPPPGSSPPTTPSCRSKPVATPASTWSGWGDSNSRPPAPKSGNEGVSANAVSCRISSISDRLAGVMSGRYRTTRTRRHQPVQPGLIHSRYRADPR